MIAAVLPRGVFFGHSINASQGVRDAVLPLLAAFFNSFVFDYLLRLRISANLTMLLPFIRCRFRDYRNRIQVFLRSFSAQCG